MAVFQVQLPLLTDMRYIPLVAEFIFFLNNGGNCSSLSQEAVESFSAFGGSFGDSPCASPTSFPLDSGLPSGAGSIGESLPSLPTSTSVSSGPIGALPADQDTISLQDQDEILTRSVQGNFALAIGASGVSSPTLPTSFPLDSGDPFGTPAALQDIITQQDSEKLPLSTQLVDGSFALASGASGVSSTTLLTCFPLASGDLPGTPAAMQNIITQQDSEDLPLLEARPSSLPLVTLPPVPSFAIDSDVDDFNIYYEYSLDFECLDPSAIAHESPESTYYHDLQCSLDRYNFATCFAAELEETMEKFSMPVFDAICDYRRTTGPGAVYDFGADAGLPLVGSQACASSPSLSMSSTPPTGGRTACSDSPLKSSPCRHRGPRRVAIPAVVNAQSSGEEAKKQCKNRGRHIRTPEQLQNYFDSLEDGKFATAYDSFKFSGRLSPSKASIRRRNALVDWSEGPNISSLLIGVGSSL